MILVELCAGTASLSLWAMGRCAPITGFMGSKRRWAGVLTESLGCDRPERVVLVDAGPWGDVWTVLRDGGGRAVAEVLDAWGRTGATPNTLWRDCVARPPDADPVQRVAQYLWLQARSAGTIPVWWSPERGRWESPSGSRTERAHARGWVDAGSRETGANPGRREAHAQGRRHRTDDIGPACVTGNTARGSRGGQSVGKPDHPGARGIQYPETVAARLRAIDTRIPWSRVDVVHGDVRKVEPISGAIVLFDPPYRGAPRYASLLPRADVVEVARRWSDAGATVAVCEAEPVAELVDAGWSTVRLPSVRRSQMPREFVTTREPLVLDRQLALGAA